ncbi:MAG: hypothetical protein ACK5JT_09665 [Hyphomicrobiaceae bacterium]
MSATWLEWGGTLLFAGAMLAISMYVLAVAGHFPVEHRSQALRSRLGHMILWLTVCVAALAMLLALVLAWQRLPIAPAIILGGLGVLVAPLCLQPLPDSFVDSWAGLLMLSGASVILVAAAWAA